MPEALSGVLDYTCSGDVMCRGEVMRHVNEGFDNNMNACCGPHRGLLLEAAEDLLLLLLQLVAELLLGPLLLLLQETQLPQLLAPGEGEEERERVLTLCLSSAFSRPQW